MDRIGVNQQLKTHTTKAGLNNVARAGGGSGGQSKVKEQQTKTQKPITSSQVRKEGGVAAKTLEDGRTELKADSGMQVTVGGDSQEISLPGGQKFKRTSEGVSLTGGEAKDVGMTEFEGGVQMLSFKDKGGNTVQVDPDSMTYEVLNKQNNLAQVFHPDGKQEVVAFGTYRSPEGKSQDYAHSITYGPDGQVMKSEGFTGLQLKGGKLSFELPSGGRSERTLARPIQGQPESEAPQKAETPTSSTPQVVTPNVLADPSIQPKQVSSDAAPPKLNEVQSKAADAVGSGVASGNLPERTSSVLLDALGVKKHQATGEAFNPALKGEEGKAQLRDWRLGQVKDLQESGQSEWAQQVARGGMDHMAGKAVSGQLASDTVHSRGFQKQYAEAGWDVKTPRSREQHGYAPENLKGREVAFRTRNENGDIVHHRGVINPDVGQGSALFTLKGDKSKTEFNSNQLIDMAVAPKRGAGEAIAGVFTGRPDATATVEPRIETPAEPGPTPKPPSQEKLNGALLESAGRLPAYQAGSLLKSFGVEPNQKTGAEFNPSLKGEDAARQKEQWQLGQVASFAEARDHDGVSEALRASEKQVGTDLKAAKQKEKEASQAFNQEWADKGWSLKAEPKNRHLIPPDLEGKEVAFRTKDENGKDVVRRGVVQAEGGNSALFALAGQKGEFNNNFIKDLAIAPEKKPETAAWAPPTPPKTPVTAASSPPSGPPPLPGEPQMQVKADPGKVEHGMDLLKGPSRKTQSGVTAYGALLTGTHEIQVPGGLKLKKTLGGLGDTFKASGADTKGVQMKKRADGLEYIQVDMKSGDQVFVDPKSLTYEVKSASTGSSNVFHPDGTTKRHQPAAPKVETPAVKAEAPKVETPAVKAEAPKVDTPAVKAEAPKVETPAVKAEAPKVETPAVKAEAPKVDTPAVKAEAPKVETPAVKAEAPQVETPVVKTEAPQVETPAVKSAAPQVETPVASTEAPPQAETAKASKAEVIPDPNPEVKGFPGLTDISSDFRAGAGEPGVDVIDTPSGITLRQDARAEEGIFTRAVKLPNGQAFRTDGSKVEVLGDKPDMKNARVVKDGDEMMVAYSDKAGNNWQVNVDDEKWGNVSVSNRQGTLTQELKPDGSEAFEVRGTYTTESGKPQQYSQRAEFGADGAVTKMSGFKDIRVSGNKLAFTLPNDISTDRTLIMDTKIQASVSGKMDVSGGVAEGWGGALDAADSLISNTPKVPATPTPAPPTGDSGTVNTGGVDTGAPVSQPPSGQPGKTTPSGMSRTTMPDGSVVTGMPNGLTVTDGEQTFATDKAGNRFEVSKTPYQSASGEVANLLTFRDSQGKGYTLSDEHLDLMAQSPDGKVNQLLQENGKMLTSINDGQNKHLHELGPGQMPGTLWQTGSPGVYANHETPGKLHVDGIPNGGYDVPLQFPQPPNGAPPNSDPFAAASAEGGSIRPQPGQPQQSIKPSMWDRFKSVFTGENPWENQGPQGPSGPGGPQGYHSHPHHAPPPYMGGYPGGHAQYDPALDEMRRMNNFNNAMLVGSTVLTGLTMFSSMSMFPGSMFMCW